MPALTPRLDSAQLAAVLIESLLNGYFHVLLIQCIDALVHRSRLRHERILNPTLLVLAFLFFTISGHWIIDFINAFKAFIQPDDATYCVNPTTVSPSLLVYYKLNDVKSVMGSGFYVVTTLSGDAFMIYRLYIIWSRNRYIIIPPIILWIALAVTGGMVTYLFSKAAKPIFTAAGSWITACFALTFCCNLYSTSLIACRIFYANRSVGLLWHKSQRLHQIVQVLVESAVLYSCCLILSLATYVANSNMSIVFVAATNPIIGIIFCMIITRAQRNIQENRGLGTRDDSPPNTGVARKSNNAHDITNESYCHTHGQPLEISMHKVEEPPRGEDIEKNGETSITGNSPSI